MRLGSLEIPQTILDAQKEGKVVFFLGAGISMDSPSSLPDFYSLTKKVSENTPLYETVSRNSQFDEILQNLEIQKVNVRELVKKQLSAADSKPNKNHEILVKLSLHNNLPRIITTNLDLHLESIMKALKTDLEIYKAPALPLGREVSGLIYLHGQILQDTKKYVLTKKDFALAYLIDGWATRFLKEVFESYVVVFVGYSISDPIMDYLTWGISEGKGTRFIITPDRTDMWENKSIFPIYYDSVDGVHGQLTDSLEKWLDFYSMDLFDHKNKMKSMLSALPSFSDEDNEYLLFQLKKEEGCKHFFSEAKSIEWLGWAIKQNLHQGLFVSTTEKLSLINNYLAEWICKDYLFSGFSIIAEIIKDKKFLSSSFFESICISLWRHKIQDDEERKTLSYWSKILVSSCAYKGRYSLFYVLEKLIEQKLIDDAIDLLHVILQPVASVDSLMYENTKSSDPLERNKLKIKPDFHIQKHKIDNNFKDFYKSNFHLIHNKLLTVLLSVIQQVYSIEEKNSYFSSDYDSLSYRRVAVETHQQNFSEYDIFDQVLDLFNELVLWLANNNSGKSENIEKWIDSKYQLLRRSAVFYVSNNSNMELTDKLNWIEKNQCLFDRNLYHEVFDLFECNYKKSNDEEQKKIVNFLKVTNAVGEEDKGQVSKILIWLYFNNRDSEIIKLCFSDSEREEIDKNKSNSYSHLDLTRYVGEVKYRSTTNNLSEDQITDLKLEDITQKLNTLFNTDQYKDSYNAFLTSIETAAKENQNWTYKLLIELKDKDNSSDLIKVLLRSLKYQDMLSEKITLLFDILKNINIKDKRVVVDSLQKIVEDNKNNLTQEQIIDAFELVKKLFLFADSFESNIESWLSISINRNEGKLAFTITHLISATLVNKLENNLANAMLNELVVQMSKQTFGSSCVKCILCSQVYFYYHNFKDWTLLNLLPLFDTDIHKEKIKIAFDGYLTWGKWSEELLEHLRLYFTKASNQLDFIGKDTERFFEYIAGFCVYSKVSPLDKNWLIDILYKIKVEHRENFHRHLKYFLSNVEDDKLIIIWNFWLKVYWKTREEGKPLLSSSERSLLLEVGIRKDQLFLDIIKYVIDLNTKFDVDDHVLYIINENKLAENNPVEVTQLLMLFTNRPDFMTNHSLIPILESLKTKIESEEFEKLKKFYIEKGFDL